MRKFLLILFVFSFFQSIGQTPMYKLLRKQATACADSDGQAFITAAGITDATQKTAICNLVQDLKDSSLWTSLQAIYPMVGGSASTCKWNLKDPQDTDAAFRLSFINSPTIDANGVAWNGTTQYANTFFNPTTLSTSTSTHISYYSLTDNTNGGNMDIGAQTLSNANQRLAVDLRYVSGQIVVDQYDFSTSRIFVAIANSTGYFICSRTGATSLSAYKNGVSIGSSTGAAGTMANANIFIGAGSNGTGVLSYGNRKCAFATIGTGLDATQARALNNIVEEFNDALGRGNQ